MGDTFGVAHECSSHLSGTKLHTAYSPLSPKRLHCGDANTPNGVGSRNGCDHLGSQNVRTCQNGEQVVSNGSSGAVRLVGNASAHQHSTSNLWQTESNGGSREGCEGQKIAERNGQSHGEGPDVDHHYGYQGCDNDGGYDDDDDDDDDDEAVRRMEGCVTTLLQALGEDVKREGLLRTPFRVAKTMQFFTEGYGQTAKEVLGTALFYEEVAVSGEGHDHGGCAGVVVVQDIDLSSICIGCLSPLRIRCHVGYVPSKHRIVGLSKLPRIGEMCARRLQSPWRMADNLAEAVHGVVMGHGVGVVVETWHLRSPGSLLPSSSSQRHARKQMLDEHSDERCTMLLDVEESGGSSIWVHHVEGAARGILQHDRLHWEEFLASLQMDKDYRDLVPLRSDCWFQKECLLVDSCDHWCALGCGVGDLYLLEGAEVEKRWDCDGDCTWGQEVTIDRMSADSRAGFVPTMVSAVESLLYIALKGNLPRNMITRIASRYIRWLLWSTCGGLQNEVELNRCKSSRLWLDSVKNMSAVGNCNGQSHKNEEFPGHSSAGAAFGDFNQQMNGNRDSLACVNHASFDEKSFSKVGTSVIEASPLPPPPHSMEMELCVPFSSLCEHHLLPFYGVAHIAYVYSSSSSLSSRKEGSGWVQGRAAIDRGFVERIVSAYARRLQVQERLGHQVARVLGLSFNLQGVMVIVEANHLCMMARGVKQVRSRTFSTAMRGCFSTSAKLRAEFLHKLPKKAMSRDFI